VARQSLLSLCEAICIYTNISGRSSLTSTITSAGTFNRCAASRMASALGASYRQ